MSGNFKSTPSMALGSRGFLGNLVTSNRKGPNLRILLAIVRVEGAVAYTGRTGYTITFIMDINYFLQFNIFKF